MGAPDLGFIGLGQMGAPMATNIAKGGFPLSCYDAAGTQERLPEGGRAVGSTANVAAEADTVFLSLPDGKISMAVAEEIIAAPDRKASVVVDLSTIGPAAARDIAAKLAEHGITYIDAPVSGGAIGAKAGTITVMWAGPKAEMDRHADILAAFAKNPFHVGDEAGQGQAVKLLNNFLSATAMAASSEAVLYGLSQGLDMKVMLDVVNVSTGQNTATRDKFPDRVMTGTFDAGFFTKLLNKDVQLFRENARAAGTPHTLTEPIADLWQEFNDLAPDSDFTRVYEFIRDGKVSDGG